MYNQVISEKTCTCNMIFFFKILKMWYTVHIRMPQSTNDTAGMLSFNHLICKMYHDIVIEDYITYFQCACKNNIFSLISNILSFHLRHSIQNRRKTQFH